MQKESARRRRSSSGVPGVSSAPSASTKNGSLAKLPAVLGVALSRSCKSEKVTTELLSPLLYIPAPSVAMLPHRMQLVTVGFPRLMLSIPPPQKIAQLLLKVQLVTVGLLLSLLLIPPPLNAILP